MTKFETAFVAAREAADFVLIDTPGGDTAISRMAHGLADLIVTPMNDSFVDFDMLGHVDPVTMELQKPSLYSLTVWEARKARALSGHRPGPGLGGAAQPPGHHRGPQPQARRGPPDRPCPSRVGFRMGPGLRDRVIYRELFPFGLTIADLSPQVRPVPVSLQHVAARQELRALMHSLAFRPIPGNSARGPIGTHPGFLGAGVGD